MRTHILEQFSSQIGRVIFVPSGSATIGVLTPETQTYSTVSVTPTLPSAAFDGGVLALRWKSRLCSRQYELYWCV